MVFGIWYVVCGAVAGPVGGGEEVEGGSTKPLRNPTELVLIGCRTAKPRDPQGQSGGPPNKESQISPPPKPCFLVSMVVQKEVVFGVPRT